MSVGVCTYNVQLAAAEEANGERVAQAQHRYVDLVASNCDSKAPLSTEDLLEWRRELLALAKMQRSMHPLDRVGNETGPLLVANAHLNLAMAYRHAGYLDQVRVPVGYGLQTGAARRSQSQAGDVSQSQAGDEHCGKR